MMKSMRAGVAATVLGAAVVMMAGCTGTGLPSAVGGVTGGVNGAPSQSGGSCPTSTAGGTSVGTSAEGDYQGKTLPNGWDTAYHAEADVTARISQFADAAKGGGQDATTWTSFKCLYAPAVAIWRTKTGRTD